MKTLSMMMEASQAVNDLIAKAKSATQQPIGLSNHYTPVENIITNVKNLYASRLGFIVEKFGNYGIILRSHLFVTEEDVRSILYTDLYQPGTSSVYTYVYNQGLTKMQILQEGDYKIVTFEPEDIAKPATVPTVVPSEQANTFEESKKEYEVEAQYLLKEDQYGNIQMHNTIGDQEIDILQKNDLRQLLGDDDKVKAAKAFATAVAQNMKLPENYYIKAVRDEDGNESVALRYRYEKRRPFGKTQTITKTLMNIYGLGDDGIWVDGYDDKASVPEEMRGIIDDMLNFIGVRRTADNCSFTIAQDPNDIDDIKRDMGQGDENNSDDESNDDNNQPDEKEDAIAQADNEKSNDNANDDNGQANDNSSSESSSSTSSFASRSDGMSMS